MTLSGKSPVTNAATSWRERPGPVGDVAWDSEPTGTQGTQGTQGTKEWTDEQTDERGSAGADQEPSKIIEFRAHCSLIVALRIHPDDVGLNDVWWWNSILSACRNPLDGLNAGRRASTIRAIGVNNS